MNLVRVGSWWWLAGVLPAQAAPPDVIVARDAAFVVHLHRGDLDVALATLQLLPPDGGALWHLVEELPPGK